MRRVKRKEGTPHVFQCSIYRSGRPIISFSERAPSSLPSGCPLLNVPKSLRSQGDANFDFIEQEASKQLLTPYNQNSENLLKV